jgi:hypothetical protein
MPGRRVGCLLREICLQIGEKRILFTERRYCLATIGHDIA